VTVLPRERPDLFLCRSVEDTENYAHLRWTVDEALDLDLVRRLYEALDLGERHVPYRDILAFVLAHPELARLNADIKTWDPVARVT
jgi:spore coat polysaccharide biosynthesis protein SpsF